VGASYSTTSCGIPHPHLGDEVNRNIVRSEIEGGVYLRDLPAKTTLSIRTLNRSYRVEIHNAGMAWISGHPEFCPEPVLVRICGSNWGGSMLKAAYLGRGMHLEFRHPAYEQPIITSEIVEISEIVQ